MKSHLIVPCFVLVSTCGLLVWRAGEDAQFVKAHPIPVSVAVPAQAPAPAPVRVAWSAAAPQQPEPPALAATGPWPNTEVVNRLRGVQSGDAATDPAAWRAAIAKALPALATDQNVQLLVGDMLTSKGDPIDGLAWLLLACMNCTQVDERIGYGCAAEGFCDPNLAYIDVLKRDLGEAMVADALVRMEEIEARIATGDPSALAIFTEIDDRRFPKDVGECVQLRTPTPECPPEEILRQTREAYE